MKLHVSSLAGALLVLLHATAFAQSSSDAERGRVLFDAKKYAEARPLLVAYAQANVADADAQFWAGRVLMEEDRSGDAEEWLEKAVKLDSANSLYWLWLGRSYGDQTRKASIFRRRGLALRTRAAFEKAVALDAANLDARSHLVDFHLEAPGIVGGDEAEALRQAEEIRRLDEPRGQLELARVYELTKRPAQADSLLAAYGRGPPTTDTKALSEAEWVRGRILERAGDLVRARASYQAALELDPRNVAAAESLRSLR